MIRQIWIFHLFLNSLFLFFFAGLQLVLKIKIGFWLPLFIWSGGIFLESLWLKKRVNRELNLEKWIFQIFCIFGSLSMLSSLDSALKPVRLPQITIPYKTVTLKALPTTNNRWFLESDFLMYWEETQKHPFQEISEKKPLDPVLLAPLPFPPLSYLNWPVAPYPQFQQISSLSQEQLLRQFLWTEEEKKGLTNNQDTAETPKETKETLPVVEDSLDAQEEETKRLKELKKLGARPFDTVLLKSGVSLEGVILNQLDGNVLLEIRVGKGKGTKYTAKKQDIQEILPALPLAEVYLKKFKETSLTDAHLSIAQDLVSFSETYQDITCLQAAQSIYLHVLKNRSNQNIYLALDQLYLKESAMDKRVALYQTAREQGTAFSEFSCREAEVLMELGLHDLARQRLLEAKAQDPSSERVSTALVQMYLQNFELEKAQKELQRMGSLTKSYTYGFAHYLYRSGQFAQAEQAFLKMLPEQQTAPDIAFMLGNCLYYQNKFLEASVFYQQALSQGYSSALANLASCYVRLKQKEKAFSLYTQWIQEHPENPVLGYLGMAIFELGQNELVSAQRYIDDALKADPSHFLAVYYSGVLLYIQGEKEQAEEQLKNALSLNFAFKMPCLILTQIQYENEQLDLATLYLEEYLTVHTLDIDRKAQLAHFYLLRNDEERAVALFNEILSTAPTHLYTLRGLGYLQNLRQNQREALNRFEEVLATYPEDSYSKTAYQKIKNNLNYLLWEDNFSRKDSLEIARRWSEEENVGIQIQIKEQKAFFEGTQTEGNQYSYLDRTCEAEDFISFRAEFLLAQGQALFGIALRPGKNFRGAPKLFYFGRDKNNQIVYSRYDRGQQTFQWEVLGLWPDDQKAHTLSLERQDYQQGTFRLLIDEKEIATNIAIPEFKTGALKVGTFGMASSGMTWAVFVDNVQLVEKKK